MSSDTTVSAFEHVKRGDADYFQTLEMDVLKNSRDKHRYSLLSFARRKRGNSLLSFAARYGELSCCQVIYRRCPQLLYERNKKGNTPLHHAAYNGHNEVIKFLLTARATVEQEAKGTKIEGGGGGVVETILIDEELLMMVSDQKETALHFAAVEGHLESVKFLLEADRSKKLLGMVEDYKSTALHLAVKYHHLEIVEVLVEADPDFEYSANTQGKTPLYMACEQALLSGDRKTADIRKFLIRKQPTQCRLPIRDDNWTLIHHAAHKGDISAVKEIIHFWPDCSELVNKEGQNFLHLAVMFEQVNILKYILELRNIADNVLNGQDNYGNTPLHLSTTSVNQSIALALLDDPRINKMAENKQGKKALDMASRLLLEEFMKGMYPIQCASRGDVDFFRAIHVDVLRESKDEDGESVLSIAARKGHLNCCEVIFEKCPELLYQTTQDKITILHTAASNGKDDMVKFLLSTQHKMGQQGVKNVGSGGGEGKNDNKLLMMVSDEKATALHSAAWRGHLESVKLLLEADRSKKLLGMVTTYKSTALHLAVKYHHLEIVEVLVETDPDFEYSADDEGKTPLFIAWEKALSGDQRRAHIRKLLIRKQPTQCRLPIRDDNWTLIHHAAHKGDITAVKEIIHFWPDCSELVDKEGQNFLHLAVKFEQVNILKYILELRNIGDSVLNGKDNYGNTPLHLATISINRSIALALLDDPRVSKTVENKQGKNPLDIVSSVLEGELIKVMYPIQCARKGDVDFFRAIHVDVLRASKDEDGESVLSIVVRKGHLNCCEVISEKCPELLYQTTKDKITILHTAASNGKDDIVKFLLSTQHKMGQQGVKNVGSGGGEGKNDNKLLMMLSDNHRTALHFAVEKGHFLSAKLLIEASPSNELSRSTDSHKETAMHFAVKRHHLDIVKLLVEADPEFDYSANDSGHTPLFIAMQEALSGDQITVEIRKFIIQKQPKQCKVRMGTNGWTMLHHATFKGDLSAVEEITLFCPDCSELVDNEKRNFLHLAIKFEHENLVKLIVTIF